MNRLKLKLLDELMAHLSGSQGSELKSLLDESRKPKEMDSPELDVEGKPKGLKVESIEVMGKKPDFDDQANEAIASNDSEKKKSLGEAIGYPGFPKPKAKEDGSEEVALNGDDSEMTDEELEELMKKLV